MPTTDTFWPLCRRWRIGAPLLRWGGGLLLAAACAAAAAQRPPPYVPGELIVKPKVTAAKSTALITAKLMTAFGGHNVRAMAGGSLVINAIPKDLLLLLDATTQRDRLTATLTALARDPDVAYVHRNYLLTIDQSSKSSAFEAVLDALRQTTSTGPNDPLYRGQWPYQRYGKGEDEAPGGIGLADVWPHHRGDGEVVVAVIDSGILATHEDIADSPNLLPGYDMVSLVAMANDGDGRDGDPTDPGDAVEHGDCAPPTSPRSASWHGTHVAATVGAVNTNNGKGVAGINWRVKVLPIRALGRCGGLTSDIVDALRWAAGEPVPGAPDNPHPADVINLSLAGAIPCGEVQAYQEAIDAARQRGATVVVAAGNSAADAAGFTPASCRGAITVAANDWRGHLTSYSNWGEVVDLLAPGGDLQRDDNGDGQPDGILSPSQGDYRLANGTSMAAPHVAGLIALMISADPSLKGNPQGILARLKQSALPRSAEQCPRPCGAGLVNAPGALGLLQ